MNNNRFAFHLSEEGREDDLLRVVFRLSGSS